MLQHPRRGAPSPYHSRGFATPWGGERRGECNDQRACLAGYRVFCNFRQKFAPLQSRDGPHRDFEGQRGMGVWAGGREGGTILTLTIIDTGLDPKKQEAGWGFTYMITENLLSASTVFFLCCEQTMTCEGVVSSKARPLHTPPPPPPRPPPKHTQYTRPKTPSVDHMSYVAVRTPRKTKSNPPAVLPLVRIP